MEYIVCKFGGSSVATSEKIRQIEKILSLNPKRRCVVLSAPGKSQGITTKVTDLLIHICKASLKGYDVAAESAAVKKRYHDIYEPLGVSRTTIEEAVAELDQRIHADSADPARYSDAIIAFGEELSARLFAAYLQTRGIAAQSVLPQQIGLLVTEKYGDAQALPESSTNLSALKTLCQETIVVFPGFFGITRNNHIATFSRGGSDLTGALVAEALDAVEYENWTDVDGIYSANPTMIPSPCQIPSLTYKEMRELSYMGFNVLHEEAVKPVRKKKIPIRLRNTNNLDNSGTLIVTERLPSERDIIGIACGGRFCSFTVHKFLMNREIGFVRRLLEIFEKMGLSFEHCPSGVDNISVILDQNQLHPESVNNILRDIENELQPDDLRVEFGIALIAVVGEGLIHKIGLLSRAATALARSNINIKIANQGSSEISMIFGIDFAEEEKAVNALYDEFFKDCRTKKNGAAKQK